MINVVKRGEIVAQIIVKRKTELPEDELMHFKYIKRDKVNGKWRYYYDYNNGDGWSDKAGVAVSKTKNGTQVELFNTKNTKYWDKHQKTSTKKYGAVTVSKAEDGTSVVVNFSTKKVSSFAKKTVAKGKNYLRKLLHVK